MSPTIRATAAAIVAAAGCAFQPSGLGGPPDDAGDPATDGPPVDGRVPDAALPPDAATCPTDYRLVRGAYYRLPAGSSSVVVGGADCDDDRAGRTHLATFENGDLDGVLDDLGVANNDSVHVGATCSGVDFECDVTDVWRWVGSNSAVAATLWQALEPRGGWDRAFATRTAGTWGLVSGGQVTARRYLCECEP